MLEATLENALRLARAADKDFIRDNAYIKCSHKLAMQFKKRVSNDIPGLSVEHRFRGVPMTYTPDPHMILVRPSLNLRTLLHAQEEA